jgi:hypothetical protein
VKRFTSESGVLLDPLPFPLHRDSWVDPQWEASQEVVPSAVRASYRETAQELELRRRRRVSIGTRLLLLPIIFENVIFRLFNRGVVHIHLDFARLLLLRGGWFGVVRFSHSALLILSGKICFGGFYK